MMSYFFGNTFLIFLISLNDVWEYLSNVLHDICEENNSLKWHLEYVFSYCYAIKEDLLQNTKIFVNKVTKVEFLNKKTNFVSNRADRS